MTNKNNDISWPALSAQEFQSTSHLLHMGIQIIGKLMLQQPFAPHWSHLAMPLTSRGITTGIILYHSGTFSVEADFIEHAMIFTSSWGQQDKIKLESMSVAKLYQKIFVALKNIGVDTQINLKPQEVSNPIPFDQDNTPRHYDENIVNRWWRILLSTYCVLLKFHSHFYGISPSIGLFWGTLDLRDARYKGLHLPIAQGMSDYITRNAMDDVQVEVGWSCSNEKYPIPSFFAFAYPIPSNLEKMKIKLDMVKWIPEISEFVLDYEDLRKMENPEDKLLQFFESYYQIIANLAHWDIKLTVSGKPI